MNDFLKKFIPATVAQYGVCSVSLRELVKIFPRPRSSFEQGFEAIAFAAAGHRLPESDKTLEQHLDEFCSEHGLRWVRDFKTNVVSFYRTSEGLGK